MQKEISNLPRQGKIIDTINSYIEEQNQLKEIHELKIPLWNAGGICDFLTNFYILDKKKLTNLITSILSEDINKQKSAFKIMSNYKKILDNPLNKSLQDVNLNKGLNRILEKNQANFTDSSVIFNLYGIGFAFTPTEWQSVLAKIMQDKTFAKITSLTHSIMIQCNESKYTMYDPDRGIIPINSINELVEELKKAFYNNRPFENMSLVFNIYTRNEALAKDQEKNKIYRTDLITTTLLENNKTTFKDAIQRRDYHGETPLHLAVKQNDLELSKNIKSLYEDSVLLMNGFGRIPLHDAIIKANYPLVKALLTEETLNMLTLSDLSPVDLAIEYNTPKILVYLLNLDANIDHPEQKIEALSMAVYKAAIFDDSNRVKIVNLLIKADATVKNYPDLLKMVINMAIDKSKPELLDTLLQERANFAHAEMLYSILDYAIEKQDTKIIQQLLNKNTHFDLTDMKDYLKKHLQNSENMTDFLVKELNEIKLAIRNEALTTYISDKSSILSLSEQQKINIHAIIKKDQSSDTLGSIVADALLNDKIKVANIKDIDQTQWNKLATAVSNNLSKNNIFEKLKNLSESKMSESAVNKNNSHTFN